MNILEEQALMEARCMAQETYDAAADFFDATALSFWDRYGTRTIARLPLAPGAHVLDVGCGTGASALPAAEAVGPTGFVRGADLAENLLQLARSKAQARGLRNVDFQRADMTRLGFADHSFDAVISVFSIFFVPDMESQVAELWRMVRTGGKLAITTWGPRWLAPAYEVWRNEVRLRRPDLYSGFNPWDRITTPDALQELFQNAGIRKVELETENGVEALHGPDAFWTIAMGSGLRWTIEKLGTKNAEEIRQAMRAWIVENCIDQVETNVIYAVAERA